MGCFGLVPSGDGPNESCRLRALGGGPADRLLPLLCSGDDGCDVDGDAVVGLGGRPPPGLVDADAADADDAAGPRSRPPSPPAMAAISASASAAALAGGARGLLCGVVAGEVEAEETAPMPGEGGWAACGIGMCRGDAGGVLPLALAPLAADVVAGDRGRGGRPGILSATLCCVIAWMQV